MTLRHHLASLLLFILAARGDEHLCANGPFGKAHLSAKFPLPHNCNVSISISPRSTSLTVIDLQVSSTKYSNSDQMFVSWIALANTCPDDFMGIYFVETPTDTGTELQLTDHPIECE